MSLKTSYGLSDLTCGTNYNFREVGFCGDGMSVSNYSTTYTFTTMGTICNPPSDFKAAKVTRTSAHISWKSHSGKGAVFTLQWKLANASAWNTVTGISKTSYDLSGLTPGRLYLY